MVYKIIFKAYYNHGRRAVATKAPLRVHFLLTFIGGQGGKEQETAAVKERGEGGVYRESAKVLRLSNKLFL